MKNQKLLDQIKTDREKARKGSTTLDKAVANLLTTLLGETETALKGKQASKFDLVALIKKFKIGVELSLKHKYSDLLHLELCILSNYLPAQMTEEQIRAFMSPLVANKDNLGQIMGYFSKTFNGRYDGKLVASIAKEMLE